MKNVNAVIFDAVFEGASLKETTESSSCTPLFFQALLLLKVSG